MRVSGGALATTLAVSAGLAGSVQVAVMSRLGERVGVVEAVAFAALLTAGIAVVALLVLRRSFAGVAHSAHQPWWMLTGGVLSLLIVFTITYAGPRIGVTATVGVIIGAQLVMGAAIDRFGLFGSHRVGLHWERVLGILLLAAGAALSLRK
jgi:bacterial/archaeal transporter family-2 protein